MQEIIHKFAQACNTVKDDYVLRIIYFDFISMTPFPNTNHYFMNVVNFAFFAFGILFSWY